MSFSPRDELPNPCGIHFLKGSGYRYKKALLSAQIALDSARPEIVHVHGLWTLANHAMIVQTRKRRIPVVISIRGMLDPWALKQKRGKKLLAMLLYQWRDIRSASLLHATAQQEYENIRKKGFRQPIAVIPNGVEVPAALSLARHGAGESADRLRTALFLARLHPGKGLLDLAEAWARVRPQGWRMRVVGPDTHGHQKKVDARLRHLGIEQEWIFEGSVDDTEKWQYYQQADLFILPSHSENFGISIAEALYAGLPVITTKGTPWSELQGNSKNSEVLKCGWWTDIGVLPLVDALREATTRTDAERGKMGHDGHSLIETRYRWTAVSEQMVVAYKRLLKKDQPENKYSKTSDVFCEERQG